MESSYDSSDYSTPETEWRYEYRLLDLMKKKAGLEAEIKRLDSRINYLKSNTPEKVRQEKFEKLLDAEIGDLQSKV